MRRTLALLFVTGSATVMVEGDISGPVMAMGESDRPFRRHASAAAVAIGPGIPFTMTCMSSLEKEESLICSDVRWCCDMDGGVMKAFVVEMESSKLHCNIFKFFIFNCRMSK